MNELKSIYILGSAALAKLFISHKNLGQEGLDYLFNLEIEWRNSDKQKRVELLSEEINRFRNINGILYPVDPKATCLTDFFGDTDKRGYPHQGIDIAPADGKIGTPIIAGADGRVYYTGVNDKIYGNYITIDYGHCMALYAHCNNVFKEAADRVAIGEKIATIGNSGASTGPHLHFNIRIGNQNINPLEERN